MDSVDLVGRSKERRRLAEWLRKPGDPVALVGPGGAGKSSLAADLDARWVDLSGCRDLGDVLDALAAGLGVDRVGETDGVRFGQLVARGDRIVVLDGCEAVLGDLVSLVGDWEPARVLLTSRVRPSGRFRVMELGPLGLPQHDTLEAVRASEAGRLFLLRAARARPGWEPHPAEGSTLATLVRRLDGLPLALELAAARMRTLGSRQLLAHLDDRFEVLRGPNASLEAVLDASWSLLSDGDQRVLQQLAVLRGGFEPELVIALVGDGALDRLQALVDHSLVRTWELPRDPGSRWYALYDTVREFALSRTPDAPTDRLVRTWLGERATQLARSSLGAQQLKTCDVLAVYAPDLRAAFMGALEDRDAVSAGRLALGLDVLLKTRGPASWRRRGLLAAVELGGPLRDELWLMAIGVGAVRPDPEELRALAEAHEGVLRGWALRCLARELAARGETEEAIAAAHGAVASDGDEPRNWVCVGEVATNLGRRQEAIEAFHRAIATARARGAIRDELGAMGFLAVAEQNLGRSAVARTLCTEVVERLDAIGDPRRAAIFSQLLAETEMSAGDLDTAVEAWEDAELRLAAVGERRWRSYCLAGRALCHVMSGDGERGRAGLREAVQEARLYDSDRQIAVVVAFAAAVEAHLDDPQRAEELLDDLGDQAPKSVQLKFVVRVLIDLARARALREAGDAAAASALSIDARGRLEQVPWTDWASEARILAAWARERAAEQDPAATADLCVAEGTVWFQARGRERKSLARTHANRRVLEALVVAHRSGPASVALSALLAAGWPGERVLPEAGAARVYQAIAVLRRWGLRELIEKTDAGYRLRPDAVVFQV